MHDCTVPYTPQIIPSTENHNDAYTQEESRVLFLFPSSPLPNMVEGMQRVVHKGRQVHGNCRGAHYRIH